MANRVEGVRGVVRRAARRHGPVVGALLVCSAVGCALLAARWAYSGRPRYAFLVWNLFLAWVPLGFAVVAHACASEAGRARRLVGPMVVGWLLFFPNAPYLVTDLKHLPPPHAWTGAPVWFDAATFATFVFTGMVAGLVSMMLVHDLAARSMGRRGAWAAVVISTALCGFGIYLGRVVRLNSWNVLTDPLTVARSAIGPLLDPTCHERAWAMTALYGGFVLLAYVTLLVLVRAVACIAAPVPMLSGHDGSAIVWRPRVTRPARTPGYTRRAS